MGFGTGQVRTNSALESFAQMYVQEAGQFAADGVAQPLKTTKESGVYYLFDRGAWRTDDLLRAPGAEAAKIHLAELSTNTYAIQEFAAKDFVPIREIENADSPLTPLQDTTALLINKLLVQKEVSAFTVFGTATAAGTVNSLAATVKWDATTTAVPINNVGLGSDTILSATGRRGNVGTMNQDTFRVLKDAEDIVDRVKHTQMGVLSLDIITSALDLDKINLTQATRLTSAEGVGAETTAFVFGDNFLIQHQPARASVKNVANGYQFSNKPGEIRVKDYFDEARNAQVVEASMFYDFRVVASIAGYLIIDTVA